MAERNNQEQRVGEYGVALQAAGDIIINSGITLSTARTIAHDTALEVFKAQLPALTRIAEDIYLARGSEIRQLVIDTLAELNPEGLGQAADVDFQHDLYVVQRDYARSGDKDVGDLLVQILVERSRVTERNLIQIVLNESLETVAKLTNHQVAALSLILVLRYPAAIAIESPDALLEYLDATVAHLGAPNLSTASLYHLEYARCGSRTLPGYSLAESLKHFYGGLFQRGFQPTLINGQVLNILLAKQLLVPSFHNESLSQVAAVNSEHLDILLLGVGDFAAEQIRIAFQQGIWSDAELNAWLAAKRPYLADVLGMWNNTPLLEFGLTPVGTAIGLANLKRLKPDFGELSFWV